MKRMLILASFAILCVTASAQTSTQRIIIKGGNDAYDNFMKEVFLYPSFEKGIVEFKNGQRFKSNLNYNKVLGAVQFIDEKGDTLALSNEQNIASVNIGTDLFIYSPECLQAVKTDGKARLFKNERIRIADKLKTGGYGIPNTSGTIESIDRLDTKLSYNQIDINESLLISKVITYYLENERGEILPASKKNIYNLYPKKESQIRDYIKANNLDFSKEEHFVKVTDFISGL